MSLKVGVSSGIITPPVGIPMAGFGARTEVSQGIHDDLYAKILLLEKGDIRIALITLDLIGLGRAEVNKLRKIVGKELGISSKEIMISCSHTHSGPSFKPNPLSSVSIKQQEKIITKWLKDFHLVIKEISEEVSNNLVRAKIKFGKGYVTGLSYNRRLIVPEGACMLIMDTGRMRNAVREQYKEWGMPSKLIEKKAIPGIPTGPIDPELMILRFETMRGKPIAILINFSCHPVTLGPSNLLISADYPGYLRTFIEEAENTTMLFTQGASGNIRPFYSERSFKEAERIGITLASIALKTMKNMITLPSDIEIKTINTVFDIPLRETPPLHKVEKLMNEIEKKIKEKLDEKNFKEVRKLREKLIFLSKVSRKTITLPPQWLGVYHKDIKKVAQLSLDQEKICEIQVFALGNIILTAIPGEIFVELGLEIKRKSRPKQTMLVTLANGSIGYIPTKRAYQEGGYETTSLLKPGVGEIIVKRALNLINKLENETH